MRLNPSANQELLEFRRRSNFEFQHCRLSPGVVAMEGSSLESRLRFAELEGVIEGSHLPDELHDYDPEDSSTALGRVESRRLQPLFEGYRHTVEEIERLEVQLNFDRALPVFLSLIGGIDREEPGLGTLYLESSHFRRLFPFPRDIFLHPSLFEAQRGFGWEEDRSWRFDSVSVSKLTEVLSELDYSTLAQCCGATTISFRKNGAEVQLRPSKQLHLYYETRAQRAQLEAALDQNRILGFENMDTIETDGVSYRTSSKFYRTFTELLEAIYHKEVAELSDE